MVAVSYTHLDVYKRQGLEREADGVIVANADRCDDCAGPVKAHVECAAGEVTGKTKIGTGAVGAIACDVDLAVGLERDGAPDIADTADCLSLLHI